MTTTEKVYLKLSQLTSRELTVFMLSSFVLFTSNSCKKCFKNYSFNAPYSRGNEDNSLKPPQELKSTASSLKPPGNLSAVSLKWRTKSAQWLDLNGQTETLKLYLVVCMDAMNSYLSHRIIDSFAIKL